MCILLVVLKKMSTNIITWMHQRVGIVGNDFKFKKMVAPNLLQQL